MSHLLDLMKPDIEVTVNKLVNKKFNQDPIAGEYFSKITSVMSSAYKRHGYLLEKSILNRLKENDDLYHQINYFLIVLVEILLQVG